MYWQQTVKSATARHRHAAPHGVGGHLQLGRLVRPAPGCPAGRGPAVSGGQFQHPLATDLSVEWPLAARRVSGSSEDSPSACLCRTTEHQCPPLTPQVGSGPLVKTAVEASWDRLSAASLAMARPGSACRSSRTSPAAAAGQTCPSSG